MQPVERLRTVLKANVAMSSAAGLACLALGGPVSDLLGTHRVGIVRLVGAGLLLFALDVLLLSRARPPRLVAGARLVAVADAAWTIAMVALALSGALSGAGVAVALATGVATAEFAWFEWTGAARAARADAHPTTVTEVYA